MAKMITLLKSFQICSQSPLIHSRTHKYTRTRTLANTHIYVNLFIYLFMSMYLTIIHLFILLWRIPL